TVDVAAAIYWFMPVRLLMKDRFRTDTRIARVTAPVLIMHGERDATVPIGYGERLFGMITAPKEFVRFPLGGHNDLDRVAGVDAAGVFLGKLENRRRSGTPADRGRAWVQRIDFPPRNETRRSGIILG